MNRRFRKSRSRRIRAPKAHWDAEKAAVLADFASWLRAVDDMSVERRDEPDSSPDLSALFAELCALRQNTQLQAKHSHAQAQESVALGKHVSELRNDVGTQATRLADTVHDLKRQIPEARREAQESVARELVALCEAVERTTTACMNLRLPSLLFGARRASLEEQMRTPQELLRRRVADALQRLKIEAVASIGVAFESACMRAIASTSSGATPGTVTEICRQGYRLDGNLLQTAEVRVEK